MHIFSRSILSVFIVCTVLLIVSCSSNTNSESKVNFDRSGMLGNYSSNLIVPAYNALQDSVEGLQNSATAFSESTTIQNLETLQQDLKNSRLAWQSSNFFQFGPAGMQVLRTTVNTYPADSAKIADNITSGNYNLGSLDNQAAVGFPTIGFLVHGTGSNNTEIVAQFTTDDEAQKRMDYLLDNISFIKDKIDAVANAWKASGDSYADTFLSQDNAGTDVGSSIGMLVNALVLHYERFMRDGKMGIPAGVRTGGIPRPKATEAYYGGYSVELAIANQQALRRLFQGTGFDNSDGKGLQDNLEALNATTLADDINTNFDNSINALKALNDPLSEQINTNNDPVLTAFEDMQQIVALLKADMTSELGVTITYQDNDGD